MVGEVVQFWFFLPRIVVFWLEEGERVACMVHHIKEILYGHLVSVWINVFVPLQLNMDPLHYDRKLM